VIRRSAELVGGPVRASLRAGIGWILTFVLLIVSTVAFWPAFKDATALNVIFSQLPPAVVEAFGLQDFASPSGYLRGGLYEVLVPLMFAAAAVMFVNSATAAEEDAGRIELFAAQPVTRRSFFLGRATAVVIWLAVLAAGSLASQLASNAIFGLEIQTQRIVETIALCALLALCHAGLALTVAGLAARPGLVLGIGLGAALVGYLIAALFPLSDALEPLAHLSPWDWALGGDPLVNAAEPWRYVALLVPAVALTLVGLIGFDRRDIRSA
jgi:beta-exotoxin I transport system permease protein